MLKSRIEKLKKIYHEYPRTFWILVGITFIDRLGGSLLFPFFALYITSKFNVGMTDVGVLFAAFAASSFAGQAIGGALTDRFGRKGIILFGLIASSLSTVAMGLINSFNVFFLLAFFIGILTDIAGPARQAMIADILPEDKRADGFGIMHVVFNLTVVIGPAIGGFIAAYSYFALFIIDAIISLITAALIYNFLPETKPQAHPDAPQETLGGTFAGYGKVLRNAAFMFYLGATMLGVYTYMNMNTTLGVYLRDQFGTLASGYGFLLSINAAMVVFLQFSFSRRFRQYPPMLVMALGVFLYSIGFSMYGFASTFSFFILAMVIITIGEMMIMPVSQALIASFAPEEMRGRYMAVGGFAWAIPFATGPYLAGLILDGPQPHLLWYVAGAIGLVSMCCYLMLHFVRKDVPIAEALPEGAAA